MEHLLSRGLDILTVHRRRITGLTIKTDLQKIGVTVAGYDQASTLAEAQAYLRARPPHVVILDLCLPNGDAYRLLDAYQPSRREFAVILMDEEPTNVPSHGERHRGVEALVEHQAAGYLVYPQFHNLNLARSGWNRHGASSNHGSWRSINTTFYWSVQEILCKLKKNCEVCREKGCGVG